MTLQEMVDLYQADICETKIEISDHSHFQKAISITSRYFLTTSIASDSDCNPDPSIRMVLDTTLNYNIYRLVSDKLMT